MARKKRRARRKSKELPPTEPGKQPKKRVDLDGMDVPNHNKTFDLTPVPGEGECDTQRYPMMSLHRALKGSGTSIGLAFVDDVYGMTHWLERDLEAPPSWMDPEIFIRMVVTDERVQEVCQGYIDAKDADDKRELRKLVDEIFEEVYLVYMLEQFEKVRRLVADWAVAHFAVKAEDKRFNKVSKPRRRRQN